MKILISGTSSGIGRETALLFLKNGHEVIGVDKDDSTIKNCNYFHQKCDICGDLPEINDVEIIIANAGSSKDNEAIEVNLKATIKFVEKYLNSKTKSILFVASSSARNGAEFPLYSASKGGIVTYMKYLANELGKRNITVNSISPGGVITPFNEHILNNPILYEEVKNETLLHRWAEASEIAEWIYFVTVINKSMTGEDILIDNGEMLKSHFVW